MIFKKFAIVNNGIGIKGQKAHQQVLVRDQRNDVQALLKNDLKHLLYPYSDWIRFLLADVGAVRIKIANALGPLFIFL